ncbi:MAG: hypothetical protein QOI83_2909, partial [Streptomycetaceae bacterium]|nr:hypothetical protein [Streptomycetaceae bacterium]
LFFLFPAVRVVRVTDTSAMLTDRRAEADDLYVEISAPDGELWTSGPEDAPQRVSGSALEAVGEGAVYRPAIAQAFAGPPGAGRAAGQVGLTS